MANLHLSDREITAKVVYWGAPGAGASTNVHRLHELLPYERGELERSHSDTDTDEVWTFRYHKQDVQLVERFSTHIVVAALPGGVKDVMMQGEVLRGTDALVFVADARPDRAPDNLNRLLALEKQLLELDLRLASLPMVIQVNHTDHPQSLPTPLVVRELNPYRVPVVPAMARSGRGVLDTHDRVCRMMLTRIQDHLPSDTLTVSLTHEARASRVRDDQIIKQHLRGLRGFTPPVPVQWGITDAPVAERGPMPIFEGIPPGERVRVRYDHPSVDGYDAIEILDARVEAGLIDLEVVLARGTNEVRRLTLEVHHQPAPPTRSSPAREEPQQDNETPLASEHLPEEMEVALTSPPALPREARKQPSLLLGVVGVLGGTAVGIILGYLLFV